MQTLLLDENRLASISYGLMASFGFMLMLFVYHYCKFNTMPRPAYTESQLDAAIIETSISIPFVHRIVDWIDSWSEEPPLKPECNLAVVIPAKNSYKKRFIVHGNITNIRPIQPKRTMSCPAHLYNSATAFSPISEDGEFFFADLPSPASAP
jgi:hypothetical protein